MKFNNIYYCILLLSAMLMVSCDDHEALDLGIHPGHILCDDGTVVSEDSFFQMERKNAVAVLFTEQLAATSTHPTRFLGVLIREVPQLQFCDSTSMTQGTNTDTSLPVGDLNTIAMQNSYDSKSGKGSPLADYVFANHSYGQSDFIPSTREMKMLYIQCETVNRVLRRLHDERDMDVDLLCTDSGTDKCWYWTSTEVEANSSRQAWLFSMASGTPHETPKVEYHISRAIVSYYPFND